MDPQFLSPEQLELALRFSDIMCIEDFTVSAAVLASYDWNIQNALAEMKFGNEVYQPPKPVNTYVQPVNYYNGQNESDNLYEQEENYEYQSNMIDQKREMFEHDYASLVPLQKTLSQPRKQLEMLQYHKMLAKDSKTHREQYFTTLMTKSELICKNILQSNPENKRKYNENNRKVQNNRKFINYLYTNYHPRINFTFGTFFLNLTRSYLEGKYLLVYIHSIGVQANYKRVIQLLFRQKQISKFVNEHCVSYGMFDNSDDYEYIQKYAQLKDLPAFVLFKLNKAKRSEQFVSVYKVTGEGDIFLEWLATSIGISLKKKEQSAQSLEKQASLKQQIEKKQKETKKKIEEQQKQTKKKEEYNAHTYIKAQQDELYFQIEKTYMHKRLISKEKKDQIKHLEEELCKRRLEAEKDIEPAYGQNVIEIRFRMPITGDSKQRRFLLSDKIQKLFGFVDCFCRDDFEEKFNDFDLKQTFPLLNLSELKNKTIAEVFEGSQRENIIVRQL